MNKYSTTDRKTFRRFYQAGRKHCANDKSKGIIYVGFAFCTVSFKLMLCSLLFLERLRPTILEKKLGQRFILHEEMRRRKPWCEGYKCFLCENIYDVKFMFSDAMTSGLPIPISTTEAVRRILFLRKFMRKTNHSMQRNQPLKKIWVLKISLVEWQKCKWRHSFVQSNFHLHFILQLGTTISSSC